MESRLVGAGLGTFVQIDGVTAFMENQGVVVDHIGPYFPPAVAPDQDTLQSQQIYFIPNETVKDSRWHTNLRTTEKLNEAQKQYLPLIPPPSHPIKKLA